MKTLPHVCVLLGVTALCVWVSTALAQDSCIRLTASDATPLGVFGRSFDVSHDRIAVGAVGNPLVMIPIPPAAYIFERMGDSWIERTRLTLENPDDVFGWHVALSDDRLAVAGPSLHASLFERSNGDWTASGAIPSNSYGHMIFRTDTLLVGGPGASDPSSPLGAGALRVYVRDQATWRQIQILTGREEENLGRYFDLDSNWLAVAGWGGRASSLVKIFRRTGSTESWQMVKEFIVSAISPVSLDLEGDRLLVGVSSIRRGPPPVVYDYRWDGQDWNQVGRIEPHARASHGFGNAVALQGDTLVVGDPGNDR